MTRERRVACPSCRREIRVTEAELADKRGFCAVCDARFDILPDLILGDGPLREQVVTQVALAEEALPPRVTRVVSPDGGTSLRLGASRLLGVVFALFAVLWWWLIALVLFRNAPADGMTWIFRLTHGGVGVVVVLMAIWTLFGFEELVVGRGAVTHAVVLGPLRWRRTRALEPHTRARVQESVYHSSKGTRRIRLVVVGTYPPLTVGGHVRTADDHADQLARVIDQALTRARSAP